MARPEAAAPAPLARWPRPVLLGHRGARLQAPENTLPAFRLALELGAHGVELDVRLTADGQPVVIHDAELSRTTDGAGPVARHTLEALRRLDAGAWKNELFRGTPIPTLGEVLKGLPDGALLNVELKGWGIRPDLALRAVQEILHHRAADRVLFSSFSPLILRHLARLAPQIPRAYLHLARVPPAPLALRLARALGAAALHPQAGAVTPAYVAAAHRAGLRVHVWTVNDPQEARRLLELGVDGIISDDPEALRPLWDR